MSELVDQILSHHGVKGMKWGVRRARGSRAKTSFRKAPKNLSTAELTKRIGRLEAEKKYNSLNAKDKSDGRKIAEEILTDSGKRVAKTVITGASLVLIKAAISSRFGFGVAGEVTKRLK